jgi:glyoxylase-like metal-dependent hydrolase (beta-lactamase superfamily II)/rhodanese-related sulfurtransferase
MLFERVPCDALAQSCYVIASKGEALVVDPMRDVEEVLAICRRHELRIRHVVATHVHADYISGLWELAAATDAQIGLGARFAGTLPCARLQDEDELAVGELNVRVLATPGHTPESICLYVPDEDPEAAARLLSGDTLFVGDVGRPDLTSSAGHDADSMALQLYASLRGALLDLPDNTMVWPAHGAGSMCGGAIRAAANSTLATERRQNWALQEQDPTDFCRRLIGSLKEAPAYFDRVARQNLTGAPMLASLAEAEAISSDDVPASLAAGSTMLDVRSVKDYGNSHWHTAVHISIDEGEFESWAGALLPAAPVILHARDRQQALEAQRRLRRVGHDEVSGYVLSTPDEASALRQIDAIDLFGAQRPWQVVDVRTPSEFADGHLEGALAWPLAADMQRRLPKGLDRTTPTALVCEGGYRSSAAASLLADLGLTEVANVRDGMPGWRRNHLPLARDDAAD